MKFSAKEQYALRAMVEFSRHFGEGPVSLSTVAQAEAISLAYLEHVVVPLRTAGLLDSIRGARGGYRLTRSPGSITVGEVIRALGGTLVSFACVSDAEDPPCARTDISCAARQVWERVRDKLAEALDSLTLADLC
ncbi:MAG: Rrf2 family transcriptional regulator [Chloroflexi bacterium]|nr:Rrf2 family transcriptional regulator [Chloroflexota bacterium]